MSVLLTVGFLALVFAACTTVWEGATLPIGVRVYAFKNALDFHFDDESVAREFTQLNAGTGQVDAG
jgi:hypothetical protein